MIPVGLPPASRPRPAGVLGLQAFEVPGYSSLWLANVAWNVARWVEQIAVGWIALELTGSAFLVALIGFYRNVPLFLLGMFGGVVGDRYDRRRLVLALQVVNVGVAAALAALTIAGALTYIHLAVAEIILGTSQAFDWPSRRSLTVDLVGRERLANAIALDASGQNLSRFLGPLLSGGVIALVSPGAALVILVVLYVANFALLRRLPRVTTQRAVTRIGGALASLRAGVKGLLRDEAILGVLLVTIGMNFLFFPYQQLLPVVAVHVFHAGAAGLGLLQSADAFGSLAGTVAITGLGGARHHGRLFWAGSLGAALALVAFSQAGSFTLALGILVLAGLARSGFSVYQTTIILHRCSDEMRGRAMGVLSFAIGTGPFGQLEMGSVAEALGVSFAMGASAVLCVVLTAAVVVRLPGFRKA